jgi:Minor capsid.
MNIVFRRIINMVPIETIIKAKGLDRAGNVQKFHTNNVARRMMKYMPFRSGVLTKMMIIGTGYDRIKISGPYARYQYYGKAMEGPVPRVATDRPLKYTQTKAGPGTLAGPFWDRKLVASERKVMQQELQDYIKRRATK